MMHEWQAEARWLLESAPETAVLFGNKGYLQIAETLMLDGAETVAVITGKNAAERSGAYARLLQTLDAQELALHRFTGVPAEPDLGALGKLTAFLRETAPDAVIAIGGGSVLDAAKAAWVACQSGKPVETFFGSNQVAAHFPGRAFRKIMAVPTTAGTGSEMTPYSNIVNRPGGVKQLISDSQLIPEIAVLDTENLLSMPVPLAQATGCDALAHLLEGWLNVGQDGRSELADQGAAIGVKLILQALPVLLTAPEKSPERTAAAEAMGLASALGGLVIRFKSTGLPHLMSFSWYDRIPHGIAVARLLPAAWRYYNAKPEVAARTGEIGEAFGCSQNADCDAVIAAYEDFLRRCAVPHLADYPLLTPELFAVTARSASQNRMKLELAPRPVPLAESAAVITALLEEARGSAE